MAASTWSTTDKSASLTLTGSNLIATASAGNVSARGKDPKRTGKYYLEYTSTTTQGSTSLVGFAAARAPLSASNAASSVGPSALVGNLIGWDTFGTQVLNFNAGVTITTGTVVCYAIDLDNALIWVRSGAAGNWNNAAANNPATGVGGQSLQAVGLGQGIDCYPFVYLQTTGNSITANFGGSAFTGTVPAGFTSGWDDSVSIVTNVVATQIALEQWSVPPTPAVQLTQGAIEQWAEVTTVNTRMVASQIALEQWARMPVSGGGPMITTIM
jgi:hypothetical protein